MCHTLSYVYSVGFVQLMYRTVKIFSAKTVYHKQAVKRLQRLILSEF